MPYNRAARLNTIDRMARLIPIVINMFLKPRIARRKLRKITAKVTVPKYLSNLYILSSFYLFIPHGMLFLYFLFRHLAAEY
jgi:hypothetical protein